MGDKNAKGQTPVVRTTTHIDGGVNGNINKAENEHHRTVTTTNRTFGVETSSSTVTTDEYNRSANGNLSGGIHASKDVTTTTGERALPSPAKPTAGVKPAKPSPRPVIREDAIVVGTSGTQEAKSIDMADARCDAALLQKSIDDLKNTLGKYGVLPVASTLAIKGTGIDQLTLLIADDYAGKKESTITVNYTDHLGGSLDVGLGALPVTHDNILKVRDAFAKADEAVKSMATQMKPGEAVTQDDITALVRQTIGKELRGVAVR